MSRHISNLSFLLYHLRNFAQSARRFQILQSYPLQALGNHATKKKNRAQTLCILDSSFNPPTIAHLRICTSALTQDSLHNQPKRLLLLLATQNADKAPRPAAFEQRLAMMSIFAQDIIESVKKQVGEAVEDIVVDVGVTKVPRFIDKVDVIAQSGEYAREGEYVEQVHLIGFDTLVRLLDTKYYPPDHTLQPLEGLFAKHRVRVTRRIDDDAWGGRDKQDAYLKNLSEGGMEKDGGRREWATKIELVEGRQEGEEVVSSTKVREAVKGRDKEMLKSLVTEGITDWMLDLGLYSDEI